MQRNRLAAALLAVGAQFLLVALLIQSLPQLTRHGLVDHEITMMLPRFLRVAPKSSTAPKSTPRRTIATSQPVATPVALAPISTDSLHSLRIVLFDCAPENWSRLSVQDRALCPPPNGGAPIHDAPNLMGTPSHVRDNAHWVAAWRREKTPILLPGASPDSFGIKISSNYGLRQLHYAIKRNAPEAFYKIERAYEAWHKAHPVPTGEK